MARQKLFKNLTIQEKMIKFFESHDYKPVETRSTKYKVYFNTHYIFLGKNGAVRVGSSQAHKNSLSYTPQFRKAMEKWAREQGYQL